MWYKNIKAQNFLIIVLSLIGLGSSLYFVNMMVHVSTEDEYHIQKQVFSGIFKHIIYHPVANPDYFFISISGADPSPDLLREFEDMEPAVAPASKATITYGFSAFIAHKNDHTKKGMKVDLNEPKGMSDGTVKVTAKIYQDKITAANYTFSLREKEGQFYIISVQYPDRKSL